MQFCQKCGTLMVPSKTGKGLVCPNCGSRAKAEKIILKEIVKKEKPKKAMKEILDTYPVVKEKCEKCGNPEAWWWTEQTRAADEPETQFLRCTKCRFTWRKYI